MKFAIACILLIIYIIMPGEIQGIQRPSGKKGVSQVVREKYPIAFQGIYQGNFGQSPIEIGLEIVDENGAASGYSLHKGLHRPLKGDWSWVSNASKAKFILNEPGDHKFDGHFELLIDSVTFEGEGTWYPRPGSGLGEVRVTLKRQ